MSCSPVDYCEAGTCKSRFTEFSVGNVAPQFIGTSSDGQLWFSEATTAGQGIPGGKLGKMTTDGSYSDLTVLSGSDAPAGTTALIMGVARGPDGNAWFDLISSTGKAYIGYVSGGAVTTYLFSITSPTLGRIAAGPDGNVWIAKATDNPSAGSGTLELSSTTGVIAERNLSNFNGSYGITSGPDGNMWITEASRAAIARVTPAGVVTEYFPTSSAYNIAPGGDGNIWFTESNAVGRSTRNGTIVEFPIASSQAELWDITKGPDENVWFTDITGQKIGVITAAGVITEFSTPGVPYGIVGGPDGNIWFTEPSAGKVVRFRVP